MNVADLIQAAEDVLKFESPWAKVRKIVLSPKRFDQLRAAADTSALSPPNTFAAISLEVSRFCTDRVAVLVDGHGRSIGLYSFENGSGHFFDKPLAMPPVPLVRLDETWETIPTRPVVYVSTKR